MTGLLAEPAGLNVIDETPPKHYGGRWRLNRGGIVNVWYYYDAEFSFSGGRVIWRGANGSGKSRALELLFPYLLDGNRRGIDATGAGKVRLEDLMREGLGDSSNRIGYLWLELVGVGDDGEVAYLTLGAQIRYSKSAAEARVSYFTTPLRVGEQLRLMDDERLPLGRERLSELVGADRLSETAEKHRERVGTQVFGLSGDAGRERFGGLLQLMHVLRNPDVGNRIDSGALPSILSEALPPLSEAALNSAGDELDGLSEIRAGQQRLEDSSGHVQSFLASYRRYAAGILQRGCEQAGVASSAARTTATKAKRAQADADQAQTDHQQAQSNLGRLVDEQRRLTAQISGIRQSEQYRAAQDLDAREGQVRALARAAESALDSAIGARGSESRSLRAANDRAGEVLEAVSRAASTQVAVSEGIAETGLPEPGPEPCGGTLSEPGVIRESVRAGLREQADVARESPAVLVLSPADAASAARYALALKTAAGTRGSLARARRQEALALADQKRKVDDAEKRAEVDESRADEDSRAAETAAVERDETAVALAASWRDWVGRPATTQLFGDQDWQGSAVGLLLSDREALTGPNPAHDDRLRQLDSAADEAAVPVRNRIAAERAAVELELQATRTERDSLQTEQAELEAARDPLPATPPWQSTGPAGSVPLWQLIDFRDDVAASDRPGIEGALQAAGFLTAVLHPDGALTAADGQLLLRADGVPAKTTLATVLQPDPASPLPAPLVSELLACIGYGPRSHPAWVAADGRWGNGPIEGALRPSVARHIGAQARAAARAARLAEIAEELARLASRIDGFVAAVGALDERSRALSEQVRSAPRTAALAQARARSQSAAAQAVKAEQLARQSRERAAELRTAWYEGSQVHERACVALGLPPAAEKLADALKSLEQLARDCGELAERLVTVDRLLERHARAVVEAEDQTRLRGVAESAAERGWQAWNAAETEFAALRETIGADAAQVRALLRKAEEDENRTSGELEGVRRREGDLRAAAAQATVEALHAVHTAQESREALASAVAELRAILALPGLTEAAFNPGAGDIARLPEANPATIVPAHVDAALASVSAALDTRGGPLDETGLARRQQELERQVVGTYDVLLKVERGVWLVELVDATGAQTVVEAAADLARKVAEGKAALSSREHRVFADFVLGGVAEELRGRLTEAEALIKAMNLSLASIRTSQGIGVKINWTLQMEADSPLARLRTLVATASQVRTAAQSEQLITLIKEQVEERFTTDATAGYASHLKAAMDYRDWHEIEVVITGPEPGRQRRISRRAKLSQGETRFVSYVTLFAAADAYLSGLPDTSRALRLVLLDDAFAKVDERTIGVLMGLLVRLDLDFAMTGHALWGCFPEVPALDIYEIRRRDGSAAITTHVHWDGRTRHLRST